MDALLTQSLTIALAALLYGAIGSVVLMGSTRLTRLWGSALAFIGALSGFVAGGVSLLGASTVSYHIGTTIPFLDITLRVDKLSGVFLALIGAVGALATIYGFRYMRHYESTYRLGGFFAAYNVFLASMFLVVIANQALSFLIAWEMMALASYLLVVFDHKEEANVRGGYLYFIMTHIATAFIIALSFLFYRATGSLDFDVWRTMSGSLSFITTSLVFVCALIGFGTKAGIIPLHVWLPAAHPAAPSHVSALMSGVMIKLGVYMLIRVFMDFFLHTPLWLGVVVLLLGATSSVLGVLYALAEHDMKRLLAYHSIENIGIILLGLGAALVFRTMGEETLSLLALAASLFHIVNHAVFKSLLFLSAGAVVHATNTRNMEQYGGLARRMPYAATFFLVGSIAISGIIPFNGFVSEWLTFQSLFGGIALSSMAVKSVFVFSIAALALTGGLAAACFVKAFGITFLARPRSKEAEQAHDSSIGMNIAMGVLASTALLLGVFGGTATTFFLHIAESVTLFSNTPLAVIGGGQMMVIRQGEAALNMSAIFILFSMILLATWLIARICSSAGVVTRKITWDCGFPLTPRMEMTSTAFAHSLITIFHPLLHSSDKTHRTYHDSEARSPYFIKSQSVHLHLDDLYMKYGYAPLSRLTVRFAAVVGKIQSGYVNMYILYVLLTLVALFVWAI